MNKFKYKNIAISGDIGTGKSTLGKLLAEKLGWNYLSAGAYFREWHEANNIKLEETEKIPEKTDLEVDSSFQKQMETKENIIFESRLAGWLAQKFPKVLRVLCVTDFEVAMQRVAKREGVTAKEATDFSKKRSDAIAEKFKRIYDIDDFLDPKYFNLVIDTTNTLPEQALEKVLDKLKT